MTTFHAIVWIDHAEAHVLHFDRDHALASRIRSRSHHKHQGQASDQAAFFTGVWDALQGTREVLLTGPGNGRQAFAKWVSQHHPTQAAVIVESLPVDHPTDNQLVALARQFFLRHDRMGADPSLAGS